MSFLTSDRDLSRNSYYAATAERSQRHAPLSGAIRCDVAIVGAGLAGLSAALELSERGLDVVVLEAREIGWGASGRQNPPQRAVRLPRDKTSATCTDKRSPSPKRLA